MVAMVTKAAYILLLALGAPFAGAFRGYAVGRPRSVRATSSMLFGKAFGNDPNLGKATSGGVTKPAVEIAFSNGKTINAIAGQSLADVARAAGSKIQYDCKNGDCGTCTVKLNGRSVRACVAKVPAGGPFKVQVGDVAGSAAEAKTKSLQDQLKAENAGKKKGFFG
jgi:ferredoxin